MLRVALGTLAFVLIVIGVGPREAWCQNRRVGNSDVQLGQEYTEFAKNKGAHGAAGGAAEPSLGRKILLYIPNRLLDMIDIFHVDIGAGPLYGGVVRATPIGQAGARKAVPGSLRVGLRGRRLPVFVEKRDEVGAGSSFRQSKERTVGSAEFGVGVDLFIVGAYAGVAFDELWDFVAGFAGFDPKGDDLH